jgi:hypothetical protein
MGRAMLPEIEAIKHTAEYGFGYSAYGQGLKYDDNPHAAGTQPWARWAMGWNDACADDEPGSWGNGVEW